MTNRQKIENKILDDITIIQKEHKNTDEYRRAKKQYFENLGVQVKRDGFIPTVYGNIPCPLETLEFFQRRYSSWYYQ